MKFFINKGIVTKVLTSFREKEREKKRDREREIERERERERERGGGGISCPNCLFPHFSNLRVKK